MSSKRGRTAGFVMSDEHRTKIGNSQILKRLVDHVEGKVDMSSTQVTAGLGLLKKIMPDLQSTTIKGGLDIVTQTKEQRDAAVAAAIRADG